MTNLRSQPTLGATKGAATPSVEERTTPHRSEQCRALDIGDVLIQQVAGQARRRSGRCLPSRPRPAARAGSASSAAAASSPTVSRELLVAQQPSPLIDDGGVVVRPWVSTPPMTTLVRLRVRLGMLVPPFRSGTSQARHAPAGRADTPLTGLGAHAGIRSQEPVRSRVRSPGPAWQANSSRDDPTVRAVQGQTRSCRTQPHHQGPSPASLAVHSGSAKHGCGARSEGF
jgi:hypothetical protein